MLSTGMEEGQFPRAGGGARGGGGSVAGTSVSSEDSQARGGGGDRGGRKSSVKARLVDALKGGRSGAVPAGTHTDY